MTVTLIPAGGAFAVGEVVLRDTLPLNPLTLATVIVELAQEPCANVRLPGLAEIVKSGPEAIVVNTTVVERAMLPLTPETVIETDCPGPGQLVPANIVSVDDTVPLAFRVTLEGLIDQKLHPGDGQAGEGDVLRETGPLKLSMLVNEIRAVPLCPAVILRLLGFAVIVKVGPGQASTGGMR